MPSAIATNAKDPKMEAQQRIAEQRLSHMRSEGQPGGKAGEIIAELTSRLVSGAIGFDETLSITALAQEFQASRQPVAAAISHLRSLGYVVVIPQVGCRVVSPSAAEIQDFFHVLARIESTFAGMAAERHVTSEAPVLRAIAEEVAAIGFEDTPHRLQYASAVNTYHAMIWEMSRASAIVGRTRDLWQLADFYLWQGAENFDARKVEIANKERKQIARAIERRESDKAAALVQKHVQGKPKRVGII